MNPGRQIYIWLVLQWIPVNRWVVGNVVSGNGVSRIYSTYPSANILSVSILNTTSYRPQSQPFGILSQVWYCESDYRNNYCHLSI